MKTICKNETAVSDDFGVKRKRNVRLLLTNAALAITGSFLLMATTAGAVTLLPILWEAQYPSAPAALRVASDPTGNTLDWCDGSSTTGDVAIAGKIRGISPHVYTQSGTFSVNVSVTDARGATGTSNTSTIKVR